MRKKRGNSQKETTARKITRMIWKLAVAIYFFADFVLIVFELLDRLGK